MTPALCRLSPCHSPFLSTELWLCLSSAQTGLAYWSPQEVAHTHTHTHVLTWPDPWFPVTADGIHPCHGCPWAVVVVSHTHTSHTHTPKWLIWNYIFSLCSLMQKYNTIRTSQYKNSNLTNQCQLGLFLNSRPDFPSLYNPTFSVSGDLIFDLFLFCNEYGNWRIRMCWYL